METGGDDDDFFGDQEDDQLIEKESAAEAERRKVAGYHDTFDASHDSALQDGFNDGYMDSFDMAVNIGHILGRSVAQEKLSGKVDHSYLKMASLIRRQLTQLTEETAADVSLERLHNEVQTIAAGDFSDDEHSSLDVGGDFATTGEKQT